MAQFVVAKFATASAADAAAQDLHAAIPSVVTQRHPSSQVQRDSANMVDCTVLTVAVDEVHSGAVAGILGLYGTAEIR